MAKGKRKKKDSRQSIPPWGRSQADVDHEVLQANMPDVPLGNNDPTVLWGTLYGGMPNRSREALGPLRRQRGKYT